jgi:hypothetical protein
VLQKRGVTGAVSVKGGWGALEGLEGLEVVGKEEMEKKADSVMEEKSESEGEGSDGEGTKEVKRK